MVLLGPPEPAHESSEVLVLLSVVAAESQGMNRVVSLLIRAVPRDIQAVMVGHPPLPPLQAAQRMSLRDHAYAVCRPFCVQRRALFVGGAV